jgi:heavy metal sensor kinase
MRFKSIGFKLTCWYTGVCTLTFLLLGITAYALLTYSLSREMDSALGGIGQALADQARDEERRFYPADVDELFRRFFGFSPLQHHFDIFAPDEKPGPDPQQDRIPSDRISPEAIDHARRGEPYFETVDDAGSYPIRVVTVPVMVGGKLKHVVRIDMSLENLFKTRKQFVLLMTALFPLALVLAGGGGWLLAGRALSPVDQMTRTARKISGEDLEQRLHESGSGDELDRLAKTLNDMLDRFHMSIEQMRRFSADASHELQTPLTILKGEMEVALRQTRSAEEYQDVLRSGLEEIDRLNHLVEGLLLLARADSGVLRLDLQPIELHGLMHDIMEQMRAIAGDHQVTLQMHPHKPLTVQGDRDHLRRLMYNLLSNAIRHSPAGGVITVTISTREGWAVIQVADQGAGIPESERTRIFERFYRSTRTGSRDRQGVGLGLSISASIAKAHGGRIEVAHVPGEGAAFSLLLPR